MSTGRKAKHSYLVRGLLAAGALCFALDLNAPGRGPIDYVVIVALVAAIVWNVVQLSRLMYADGGGRAVWHVQRTAMFWLIGLMNTLWLRSGDVGSWKNIMGWVMIGLAIMDTILLFGREKRVLAADSGSAREF